MVNMNYWTLLLPMQLHHTGCFNLTVGTYVSAGCFIPYCEYNDSHTCTIMQGVVRIRLVQCQEGIATLQWRHNGRDSVTGIMIVCSTVYSDADQWKHQSSASLAFVRGIHWGPVISPHKWPVTRKMFPFDEVIMICRKTDRIKAALLTHSLSVS